jgi:hypothetical protein
MQEDPDGETLRERFGPPNGCELETTGQYDEWNVSMLSKNSFLRQVTWPLDRPVQQRAEQR